MERRRDQQRSVQSILIPYTFNEKEAIKWVLDHGFVVKKIDFTDNYMRFRQWDPEEYHKYRTHTLPNGIMFIVNVNRETKGGEYQLHAVLIPNRYELGSATRLVLANNLRADRLRAQKNYWRFTQTDIRPDKPFLSSSISNGVILIFN